MEEQNLADKFYANYYKKAVVFKTQAEAKQYMLYAFNYGTIYGATVWTLASKWKHNLNNTLYFDGIGVAENSLEDMSKYEVDIVNWIDNVRAE